MKKIVTLLFLSSGFTFAQTTLNLKPDATAGKDAFTYKGNSQENVNYGTQPQFPASDWTASGNEITIRSFIAFDLSQIPSNAIISSATLKLYAWNDPSGFGPHSTLSGSNEMVVERITSQWDEMSLTYNNMPTVTSVGAIVTPPTTSDADDLTLNVQNLIQDIVSDPTNSYGIALRLQTESYYRKTNYCSSDHTNSAKHPELSVTYNFPASINENQLKLIVSNPVNDKLTVYNTNLENKKFTILDLQGRTVLEGKLNSNNIDVTNLKSSTYLLKIENSVSKFVKI